MPLAGGREIKRALSIRPSIPRRSAKPADPYSVKAFFSMHEERHLDTYCAKRTLLLSMVPE
jgi:hypothetical protein